MQNNSNEPFDLLLITSQPRIIISPTYRLNVFGFLCSPTDPNPSSQSTPPCPGNFGFWDQRLALEWTHKKISLFSGNPQNITVGGLSAGAHSAMFQLYYDTYSTPPDKERLIHRAFLWSNAVGVQPNPHTSPTIRSQFDEVTAHFQIPATLPTLEKLSILRTIPAQDLIAAIPKLKLHTFRAVTDNHFIPATFLHSIYHPQTSDFSQRLKRNGVQIVLGEVSHEARLYRLVNAPSSRAELVTQLRNYYPGNVVDAQLRHYDLPSSPTPGNGTTETATIAAAAAWKDVYARIVSDGQIYAPIRGLTHALLSHPDCLTVSDVHRYRIAFRPPGLDAYLKPCMGVCHGADAPIWWMGGVRAGFTADDINRVNAFLEPFGRFLAGRDRDIGWGTATEREVRELGEDGAVRVVVEGEAWAQGMRVWSMMWEAQM